MENKPRRITFFVSEFQRMTGKSLSTCRREIKKMRAFFNLRKDQYLTVYHVSTFQDIPLEVVFSFQGN